MTWNIEWSKQASKDLRKLDPRVRDRVHRFFTDRLASLTDPRQLGDPLVGNRSDSWRYRIGDYRAICTFRDRQCIVLVVKVAHRREVYR